MPKVAEFRSVTSMVVEEDELNVVPPPKFRVFNMRSVNRAYLKDEKFFVG